MNSEGRIFEISEENSVWEYVIDWERRRNFSERRGTALYGKILVCLTSFVSPLFARSSFQGPWIHDAQSRDFRKIWQIREGKQLYRERRQFPYDVEPPYTLPQRWATAGFRQLFGASSLVTNLQHVFLSTDQDLAYSKELHTPESFNAKSAVLHPAPSATAYWSWFHDEFSSLQV